MKHHVYKTGTLELYIKTVKKQYKLFTNIFKFMEILKGIKLDKSERRALYDLFVSDR